MVNEVAMGPISTIGFVGLGNMGWPMARRLARRYRLAVMDVRTDVAESFASQHGTQVVTDRVALAEASDAVITMLPTGGDVREVALGSSGNPGLVAGIGRGSVLIDMGSSAPLENASARSGSAPPSRGDGGRTRFWWCRSRAYGFACDYGRRGTAADRPLPSDSGRVGLQRIRSGGARKWPCNEGTKQLRLCRGTGSGL